MGSIIDHKIGYKGEGVLRGQRHIPSENCPKYPPGGHVVVQLSLLPIASAGQNC